MINFAYGKTFRSLTFMSYRDRLKVVKDVYSALKEFHDFGVCLGDIHIDNFLYRENNPKLGIETEGVL